ncbi:hypothetical protein ACVWZR_004428 [Bradyrhizobium sp. i1.3.1]
MIILTVTSESGEPFTVRFQTKASVADDGTVTWQDSEVTKEVGQSQRYGLDVNFRLVVETPSQPDNANG